MGQTESKEIQGVLAAKITAITPDMKEEEAMKKLLEKPELWIVLGDEIIVLVLFFIWNGVQYKTVKQKWNGQVIEYLQEIDYDVYMHKAVANVNEWSETKLIHALIESVMYEFEQGKGRENNQVFFDLWKQNHGVLAKA